MKRSNFIWPDPRAQCRAGIVARGTAGHYSRQSVRRHAPASAPARARWRNDRMLHFAGFPPAPCVFRRPRRARASAGVVMAARIAALKRATLPSSYG
jgi:hypothetical protein